MKNFLQRIIAAAAPVAIQAVEGAIKGGPVKLGTATGIVQSILLAMAGTHGVTHEAASDAAAIKAQVQAIFDAMLKAGLVKPLSEVTPILDQD